MGTYLATERHRFTVEDYLRMVDAGVFSEDDRIELVDGEILDMPPPQGPEHGSIKDDLHERLASAYRDRGAHVLNQRPLRSGSHGLPEPVLAVIRGRPRDYLETHPSGSDALLVLEIAKTSQERDRNKAVDYARGQVPVYWLLDLDARCLEVFERPDPASGRYRKMRSVGEGESVTPPELDVAWFVASMLP